MRTPAAALLFATCAAGGCVSLADRIVDPPHDRAFDAVLTPQVEWTFGVRHARWRSPEGIDLAYRIIPAAHRGMTYTLTRTTTSTGFHFTFDPSQTAPTPARGTIVYLHGWSMDGRSMLPWAFALAEHGFHGLALDLRNAGESSKAPPGFGPREAADVAALLDHLRDTGDLHDPVFLFGVSYGASTALFAEPALRGRLAGIVVMEPYANAADAIHTMTRAAQDAATPGERVLLALAGRRYDDGAVDHAILEADKRLGLELPKVDLRAPVAQSQTCTLLLHGARDSWIPAAASRSLAQAAPRLRYVELPDENHMTLPVRIDWLGTPLAAWLEAVGGGQCPTLALPPDPARPSA